MLLLLFMLMFLFMLLLLLMLPLLLFFNVVVVKAADEFLRDRDAIDAALIFKTEAELEQSLSYLVNILGTLV